MLTSPSLPGSSSHKLQEGLEAIVTCPWPTPPAGCRRWARPPLGRGGRAGLDGGRLGRPLGTALSTCASILARRGHVPSPLRTPGVCPFLESGGMRYCWALQPPEAHQQCPAPSLRGSPMPGPGLRSAGAVPAQVRSQRLRDKSHDVEVAESAPRILISPPPVLYKESQNAGEGLLVVI